MCSGFSGGKRKEEDDHLFPPVLFFLGFWKKKSQRCPFLLLEGEEKKSCQHISLSRNRYINGGFSRTGRERQKSLSLSMRGQNGSSSPCATEKEKVFLKKEIPFFDKNEWEK